MLVNVERMIKIENYCLTVITVVTDSGKNHQSMPRPLDEDCSKAGYSWSVGIIPQITY